MAEQQRQTAFFATTTQDALVCMQAVSVSPLSFTAGVAFFKQALRLFSCLIVLSAPGAEPVRAGKQVALHNWMQWRGPFATGVAPFAHPPLHWSETNNIRWKFPL